MNIRRLVRQTVLALLTASIAPSQFFARAETPADPVAIAQEIQNRKAQIETINNQLGEYKKKIAEYAKKSASLMNDIALLENQTAMAELDVAGTQAEIDTSNLELQQINGKIGESDKKLARQKELLGNLIFSLHKQDAEGGALELMLGAKTFDQVFKAAADLESVNGDLRKTLSAAQTTREGLQGDMKEADAKLGDLQALQEKLKKQALALENQQGAKEVLAAETEDTELGYRQLINELRQEQQSITNRINELQQKANEALAQSDDPNPSAITWPLHGIITTLFHDPSYPFRYLFEHPGLDIATPQGSPVGAAAPGVVAWTRTGSQYGNYIMIIHENGLATLYAHLSKFMVVQDQVVSRGDIIGLSGGRPGSAGAGLSTGSHLHFEVRKGGIPVDPMPFLPR